MNQTRYLVGRWDGRLSKKSKDNLFRAVGQLWSTHEVLSAERELTPEERARLSRSCQEVSEVLSTEQGLATRIAEDG